MEAIKLLQIGKSEDGIIRLQSQLAISHNVADFILENGVLKTWRYGDKGVGFYECSHPFAIVESIKDMALQPL